MLKELGKIPTSGKGGPSLYERVVLARVPSLFYVFKQKTMASKRKEKCAFSVPYLQF